MFNIYIRPRPSSRLFITDYFDGPGRAIDSVCVCLCVRAITFELNAFDLDIWLAGSSWLCLDHVRRAISLVKVRGHKCSSPGYRCTLRKWHIFGCLSSSLYQSDRCDLDWELSRIKLLLLKVDNGCWRSTGGETVKSVTYMRRRLSAVIDVNEGTRYRAMCGSLLSRYTFCSHRTGLSNYGAYELVSDLAARRPTGNRPTGEALSSFSVVIR